MMLRSNEFSIKFMRHRGTRHLMMTDYDIERLIGETMAEVLRQRLVELETLKATGAATDDTVGKLDYVRKLLVRFDERDLTR